MGPRRGALLLFVLSQLLCGQVTALDSYRDVYGRLTCYAEALVKPESTQQLAAAVKQFAAAAKASGKPLKIRTSRSVFHSTSSFACPFVNEADPSAAPAEAETSSGSPSTVAVMLEGFNKILAADKAAYTVNVQAGLKVLDLLRWADQNGMSMDPGAPPNYAELTVGGVISANGHGSGSNVTCQVGDIALEFTWIDAAGTVRTSSRDSPEGHGLAGGLGLIGIITELKLQMTPPTNIKAVSTNMQPDSDFGEAVVKHAKVTPNLAFLWRPDLKRYNTYLMTRTKEPADASVRQGLVFTLPTFVSRALQVVLRPLQEDVSNGPVSHLLNPVNCLKASAVLSYLTWASKGLTPTAPVSGFNPSIAQTEAVGTSNRVMAGGCEPNCPWNGGLTIDDTEYAIEMEDFPAWQEDVKKVFAKDLQDDGAAADRCMPLGSYFLIRFGRANSDFMSTTSGMTNPVFVELAFFRTRSVKHLPGKYQFVQDLLEQLTLCKYKGRPHLGKNFDRSFSSADCPVRDRLPFFSKQLELQAKYDPSKVFEPELMTKLKSRAGNFYGPQCDLKRQCYCKESAHCAAGFACVPSTAFPEYKICKPAAMVNNGLAGLLQLLGKH